MKHFCEHCKNSGQEPASITGLAAPCIACLVHDDELPVAAESIFRANGVKVPPIVLRGLVADVGDIVNVRV